MQVHVSMCLCQCVYISEFLQGCLTDKPNTTRTEKTEENEKGVRLHIAKQNVSERRKKKQKKE